MIIKQITIKNAIYGINFPVNDCPTRKFKYSFSFYIKKNTIAIAGGFSAGKSEFISSFFKESTLKLPSGVRPTTAIPTYVISSEKNTL